MARLQPLRSLHFLYIVMFVIDGRVSWRVRAEKPLVALAAAFCAFECGHVSGAAGAVSRECAYRVAGPALRNPWEQAFVWVRQNTPVDAVFALDPNYMDTAGEDEIGFRCLAQRSRLADGVKDNGVVSMFPPLAEEWWAQVQAQTPWKDFRLEDFSRLRNKYGVSWVVVQQPGVSGIDCPYQNSAVRVCRLP